MFVTLKTIFYRPDWFRRQEFTGGQALGFYSLSILFLVLGFSLLLIPAAWGVNRFFESAEWQRQKAIIQSLYPDNLVLTFDNERLTTNQTDPVIIPIPPEWEPKRGDCASVKCQKIREEFPKNLIVFDRNVEVSRQAIEARDTFILASETEIGLSNESRGETRIFGTTEINLDKKIEITKTTFVSWIERGTSVIQTAILLLMAVLPLLMYLGLWIGYIMYALFGALVVWLAAHIRNHRLTYGQAYRSTLYLLPASFVVSIFMSAVSYRIPLLFTLVLFVMAFINFERIPKAEPGPSPFPPKPNNPSIPLTPARPDEPNVSR